MKVGLGIAAAALAAGVAFWPAGYGEAGDKPAAPAPGAPDMDNLPGIVFDDSIGDWVVDRFAGNDKAGPLLYQGPAREIGGLATPKEVLATPDGTVYIVCGGTGLGVAWAELMKVAPDGMARLMMAADGLIEGPLEECQAGRPLWNPKEKALYLTGPNCLRKVIEKPDGSRWVEVVAGIPNKPPAPPPYGKPYTPQDGPAREATFQSLYRGVVCNSRGTFFWLEDQALRRIEDGTVSSVPLKLQEEIRSFYFAMGGTNTGLLSLGEDDDTLYISDYYGRNGYCVYRCDVKTGELTRVCGVRHKDRKTWPPSLAERHKRLIGETDGPALTHASGNSGLWGNYDPFHRAIWIGCPDALRCRWLKLDGDGWVRTVLGALRPETKRQPIDDNGLGIPGEQFMAHYPRVAGFDAQGGVYLAHWGNPTGIWRAYLKKEVKP